MFCCIACDGEIAEEEISMVRELCTQDQLFANMDANKYIHAWIEEINKQGSKFLQNYLNEISMIDLGDKDQACCWCHLYLKPSKRIIE